MENCAAYLHKIPDVLLPRESYLLRDRAKTALVVRRLEQLLICKKASLGDRQQPIQQEVSKSAAYNDRPDYVAHSKHCRSEASREAHILPRGAQIRLGVSETASPTKSLHVEIRPEEEPKSSREGSGDTSRCH